MAGLHERQGGGEKQPPAGGPAVVLFRAVGKGQPAGHDGGDVADGAAQDGMGGVEPQGQGAVHALLGGEDLLLQVGVLE